MLKVRSGLRKCVFRAFKQEKGEAHFNSNTNTKNPPPKKTFRNKTRRKRELKTGGSWKMQDVTHTGKK